MLDLVPFVDEVKKNVIGYSNLWDDLVYRPIKYESYPPENIYHNYNHTIIEIALAGFSKEELKIERELNKLTVKGRKETEETEDKEFEYTRRNIGYRSFSKSFTISNEYKNIGASFKDGILKIIMERETPKDRKETIEIK